MIWARRITCLRWDARLIRGGNTLTSRLRYHYGYYRRDVPIRDTNFYYIILLERDYLADAAQLQLGL